VAFTSRLEMLLAPQNGITFNPKGPKKYRPQLPHTPKAALHLKAVAVRGRALEVEVAMALVAPRDAMDAQRTTTASTSLLPVELLRFSLHGDVPQYRSLSLYHKKRHP
jgi:hypothetical protein